MILDPPSLADIVLALIPAAIAAANPVLTLGLGTAAMLAGNAGF